MRHCLPYLLQALSKGADPDRMKGALYVLWNKGIGELLLDHSHSQMAHLFPASYAAAGKRS